MIEDARWIIDIPLARNNISNAIGFTKAALQALPDGSFEAIEIGNEPNFYPGYFRPKNYNVADFATQWSYFADELSANVSLPTPEFWSLSYSNGTAWDVSEAFAAHLNTEARKIKAICQHYYQAAAGTNISNTLLNHTTTVNKMIDQFQKPIAFANNLHPPIPFILGEAGSVLGAAPKEYALGASLGSAIWMVDWMLCAMTVGVKRINMHQSTEVVFAGWQPIRDNIGGVERPAQVLGSWYGLAFVADVMGAGRGKAIQVVDTTQANESSVSVVTYSIYHNGTLAQVIILNEELYTTGPRPSQTVMLGSLTVSKVKVQLLTGDNGAAVHNISWAGQRWSAASSGLPVIVGPESTVLSVENGSVDILVKATEGVLVTLLS
jgi:hypothetical protein